MKVIFQELKKFIDEATEAEKRFNDTYSIFTEKGKAKVSVLGQFQEIDSGVIQFLFGSVMALIMLRSLALLLNSNRSAVKK